jgi:hypothetical protein
MIPQEKALMAWLHGFGPIEPPLTLMLCVPILLVLIIVVVVKAVLAPVCIALLSLFRVIYDAATGGPISACNILGKLLVATLKGDDLVEVMDNARDDQ